MKLVITQANLTLKGGAERVLLKIAQHYKAKIYTAEYDRAKTFDEFKDLDVNVIGKGRITRLLPYGRVAQGLNYGLGFYNQRIPDDYDVINAHIAPSHWARNRNERVLWYCHTPLRDIYDLYEYRLRLKKLHQKPLTILGAKVVRLMDRDVVRRLEGIVANSNNTRSRILKYYGREAKVLNGGIDFKKFRDEGDGKYFLYVSRISPNKRQDYAIRAFEMFKRKHKGYRLLIAGPVSQDKFYHDYYLQVADMAQRVGDVKILPNVSEEKVASLYARATATVYTPVNEDYGLVPLESMASYKPVVSVNEGGPTETVVDGETGFLVNSEKEMAEKLAWIAEHPSLAAVMGKNGRRRVETNYSWQRFFKEFDKELQLVKRM